MYGGASDRSVCRCQSAQAAMCQCPSSIVEGIFDDRVRRGLDRLLVIDNSAGMADKQRSAVHTLGGLLPNLERVDYHIGVVTTDVGSWKAPNTPFTASLGGCESLAGDDGTLQAMSCLDRRGLSAEARAACSALGFDRRFVPMNGARFITNDGGQQNVPQHLKADTLHRSANTRVFCRSFTFRKRRS